MKTIALFLLSICLFGTVPMRAKPKDRPLILAAPDNYAWTIVLVDRDNPDADLSAQGSTPDLKASEGSDDKRDAVVKWNFKKAKGTICVECVTRGGKAGSVWIIGGMQVLQLPGQTSWVVNRHMSMSSDPFWLTLGPYGFPHTGIVSAKTYQDTESFMGKKCLIFKTQVHDPIEEDQAKGNHDIVVYVEERSRLPVFASGLENAYTFQFSKAPHVDLTPPPEVTKAIEDETKRRDRLNAVPPHA